MWAWIRTNYTLNNPVGCPNNGVHYTNTKTGGSIPTYRAVGADEVGDGMIAAWHTNDPEYPEGVVLLNTAHPIIGDVIQYWQSLYPDHFADQIASDVIQVYGEVAVSKVAHSSHLKGILPSEVVERELRSETALTKALLGLMAEDQLISTRVGGKYKARRQRSQPTHTI